ncbi:hypothetical protein AAON49_05655 [Pseudotenacibaculum sp. MALMAid0570]|uniref:hypothetical protein n=1 Tax=Pseudotenacibaculum sp. MALMAid0570 TaxID=3143938 RepID=UPI0032DE319F
MKSSHLGKIIRVLCLVLIVLIPTIVQATHHHSNLNVHQGCKQGDVHIHESSIDFCEICLLSVSPLECSFHQNDEQLTSFFYQKTVKKEYSIIISFFTFNNKQLRAPPSSL